MLVNVGYLKKNDDGDLELVATNDDGTSIPYYFGTVSKEEIDELAISTFAHRMTSAKKTPEQIIKVVKKTPVLLKDTLGVYVPIVKHIIKELGIEYNDDIATTTDDHPSL